MTPYFSFVLTESPGGTDLERGYGDVRPCPEDPLFTPLLPLARVPFQAKESVHKTPFWEDYEILTSTASIFTQILAHKSQIWKFSAHKPPNFEISAHKPPFSEANVSSQAPHFGNPGRTPYLKKSWVPPGLKDPLFSFIVRHRKTPTFEDVSTHTRHFHMWVPSRIMNGWIVSFEWKTSKHHENRELVATLWFYLYESLRQYNYFFFRR